MARRRGRAGDQSRLAGGKGSLPSLDGRVHHLLSATGGRQVMEKKFEARKWLYQTPAEILIRPPTAPVILE